MIQVGHSDTGVTEDMNSGVNILSHRTSNPGKSVSWDKSTENVNMRFTLDTHKLYLDSCRTYQSSFVRWMLGNVHQVSTVIQVNCNTYASNIDKKGFLSYGTSGSTSRVLLTCFTFLILIRMDMLLTTTPTVIGLSPRQNVKIFCYRKMLVYVRIS